MIKKLKILIMISLLSLISTNIILIPFKILRKNNINKSNKIEDPFTFIKNEIDNTIYTDIFIGEPPQKITAIVTFNSEHLEMHHQTSNNLFSDTLYERNKSKTYEKIPIKENNTTSTPIKDYFKEQIKLYTDINFKNLITINSLTFSLFEPNKKEITERSLSFNLGFKLSESVDNDNNKEINTNIILQLKQKKLISSYNFNFHYDKINIDGNIYDGYIIMGEEPHQYIKNSYNEYQLYKTKALKRDKNLSWDIYFNKIYYELNNKEIILDNHVEYYNQAALTPTSGIIEGTLTYERSIKNSFFSKLIKEKKCTKLINDFYIFYYCDRNKICNDDLKSFPTLYFSSIELDYTFELTYEDLFLEKDDYIFFLIVFYDYPEEIQSYFNEYISKWDFGTPFLKKYFFTFDYDNKYIGFYNNKTETKNNKQDEIPKITNKNNISEKKNYWIIIIIIIIIIFGIFFVMRKYYIKNKKISAIELENDNMDSDNSNLKFSKYYNVEMGQKNLLSEVL